MPLRVLHIVEGASPAACPAALAWLASIARATPSVQHRVVLLGGHRAAWAAEAAGLEKVVRRAVPWGRAASALPSTAAAMRRAEEGQRSDVVHAWSVGAAWAGAVLRRDVPRVVTPMGRLSPREINWLHRLLYPPPRLRSTRSITATFDPATVAQLRIQHLDVPLIMPTLDPAGPEVSPRAAARRRWGLHESRARVIAILSDPPESADAIKGLLVKALVREVLGHAPAGGRAEPDAADLRLLAHPRQHHRRRAEALSDAVSDERRVVQDAHASAPWRVLAGCDAAIALGEPCALSLMWARAAGVAVVVPADSPAAAGLDESTAILAEDAGPRRLAAALLRCLEDADRRRRVADAARDALPPIAPAVEAVAGLYHRATGRDGR